MEVDALVGRIMAALDEAGADMQSDASHALC